MIKDLEFRVQELTIEADQITKARNSLEAEKKELMFNIDNLTDELDALKQRYLSVLFLNIFLPIFLLC